MGNVNAFEIAAAGLGQTGDGTRTDDGHRRGGEKLAARAGHDATPERTVITINAAQPGRQRAFNWDRLPLK